MPVVVPRCNVDVKLFGVLVGKLPLELKLPRRALGVNVHEPFVPEDLDDLEVAKTAGFQPYGLTRVARSPVAVADCHHLAELDKVVVLGGHHLVQLPRGESTELLVRIAVVRVVKDLLQKHLLVHANRGALITRHGVRSQQQASRSGGPTRALIPIAATHPGLWQILTWRCRVCSRNQGSDGADDEQH